MIWCGCVNSVTGPPWRRAHLVVGNGDVGVGMPCQRRGPYRLVRPAKRTGIWLACFARLRTLTWSVLKHCALHFRSFQSF